MLNPNYTEFRNQLEAARRKVVQAQTQYDKKKRLLVGAVMNDQQDLFGERKSQQSNLLFDERADANVIPQALEPYKQDIEYWKKEAARLEGLLLRMENVDLPELFAPFVEEI